MIQVRREESEMGWRRIAVQKESSRAADVGPALMGMESRGGGAVSETGRELGPAEDEGKALGSSGATDCEPVSGLRSGTSVVGD